MSILNHMMAVNVYEDLALSNNPSMREVDWRRSVLNASVSNPKSIKFKLNVNESKSVFNGSRTVDYDGLTVFGLALNSTSGSLYRLTYTSGNAPNFQTSRGSTLNATTVVFTLNNNNTLSAQITAGPGTFGTGIVVGDQVFIPTALTGDSALSNPCNVNNSGLWMVLNYDVGSATLTLTRSGIFSGANDTVTFTSNAQFLVFSSDSARVQIGDFIVLAGGGGYGAGGTFQVSTVTPTWVEFVSTEPLSVPAVVAGASINFYSNPVIYFRVESDQLVALQLNGDVTTVYVQLSPTGGTVGFMDKWGPTFSLNVVNLSNNQANVFVITAEQ